MDLNRKNVLNNNFSTLYALLVLTGIIHLLSLNLRLISEENNNDSELNVKKIRIVGIENSKKRTVFIKQKQKNPQKKQVVTQKTNFKSAAPSRKQMDFKSLSVNKAKVKKDFAFNALNLQGGQIKRMLKQSPHQNSSNFSPQDLQLLRKTGVMVQIDPPKGVKVDELNSLELQFYSFQRRMAIQYINTILLKINEYRYKQPHLKFPYTKETERLTGKLTYDNEGNLIRIQIIEYADNVALQEYFESVLDEIGPLPNPPKSLYQETNEFSIYYSLKIQV